MAQSTIPQQTIERIKAKVDEWRASKKSTQEAMPEALWKEIAGVAHYFTRKTLIDSFKIDSRQLKKHKLTVGTALQKKDADTANVTSKSTKANKASRQQITRTPRHSQRNRPPSPLKPLSPKSSSPAQQRLSIRRCVL